MRRLATVVTLLAAGVLAQAQTQAWEKLIAPGLTYRMEIDLSKPLVVHALRWTAGSGAIRSRSETMAETILGTEKPFGRDTLSNASKRTQALGGVNGDFADKFGNPLGCMLRDGELISLPEPNRSVFGWGPGMNTVTTLTAKGTAKIPGGEREIVGLNREAVDNELVLETPTGGMSLSRNPGVHVVFTASGFLRPGVETSGTVTRVVANETSVKLNPGEWSLVGTGSQATALSALKAGDTVAATVNLAGVDLFSVRNILAGGPSLLKDGNPTIDVVKERFSNAFANDRHPRTAVGFGRDGDVWLVVVDGRNPSSRGMSLPELADFMAGLGCADAMNLDGGGSTTLSLLGLTLNRPSDGEERPVSNGFLLYGDLPAPTTGDMVIKGTPTLVMGQPFTFSVVDQNGETIPNAEVLWAAKGGAWIDQAGTLRPLKPGECTVSASVRGKVLRLRVNVVDAS